MTNVIKFPGQDQSTQEAMNDAVALVQKPGGAGVTTAVLKGVWVVTVLIWPILKWVVSLDCVYHLVRMIYHWNTPGVYEGWTFTLHFAALTALIYFVSVYKPKCI
ncbi:MAG: KleE stable inheritance protein [Burkholderiaceae bacterium]